METTPSILLAIRQKLPKLSGNYRLIAEKILEHPEAVIQQRVSDCAGSCHCDPAQVIRFCQKLGFDGFSDLKNRITEGLLDRKQTLHQQLSSAATDFDRLKENFSAKFTRTINDTLALQKEDSLLKAAAMVEAARLVMVSGVGSSGLTVQDLLNKLFRIGYHAMFWNDAENNRTAAASLSESDLLIAVSFSGETEFLLAGVRIAKDNRVPILALTNYPQSTLAKMADCVLLTASEEQRLRIGTMDSTIAQYLVIDLLSTLLASRNLDHTEKRILQIYEGTEKNSVV